MDFLSIQPEGMYDLKMQMGVYAALKIKNKNKTLFIYLFLRRSSIYDL